MKKSNKKSSKGKKSIWYICDNYTMHKLPWEEQKEILDKVWEKGKYKK